MNNEKETFSAEELETRFEMEAVIDDGTADGGDDITYYCFFQD